LAEVSHPAYRCKHAARPLWRGLDEGGRRALHRVSAELVEVHLTVKALPAELLNDLQVRVFTGRVAVGRHKRGRQAAAGRGRLIQPAEVLRDRIAVGAARGFTDEVIVLPAAGSGFDN
jgi:hypothetical protein